MHTLIRLLQAVSPLKGLKGLFERRFPSREGLSCKESLRTPFTGDLRGSPRSGSRPTVGETLIAWDMLADSHERCPHID